MSETVRLMGIQFTRSPRMKCKAVRPWARVSMGIAAERRKGNAVPLGWEEEILRRFLIEPSGQDPSENAMAPQRCIIAPFILKGSLACITIQHFSQKLLHFRLSECNLQEFHHLIIGQLFWLLQERFQHTGPDAKSVSSFLACQFWYSMFQNLFLILPVAKFLLWSVSLSSKLFKCFRFLSSRRIRHLLPKNKKGIDFHCRYPFKSMFILLFTYQMHQIQLCWKSNS